MSVWCKSNEHCVVNCYESHQRPSCANLRLYSYATTPQTQMTLNCNGDFDIWGACDLPPYYFIWNSSYWDTSRDLQFHGLPINCDQSTPCTIICDTSNGCKDSVITCPLNHICDITCGNANDVNQVAACEGIKINSNDAIFFRFKYEGVAPLQNVLFPTDIVGEPLDSQAVDLTCRNDFPANALTGRCGGMTRVCPKYSNCDIECEAYACNEVCIFMYI